MAGRTRDGRGSRNREADIPLAALRDVSQRLPVPLKLPLIAHSGPGEGRYDVSWSTISPRYPNAIAWYNVSQPATGKVRNSLRILSQK